VTFNNEQSHARHHRARPASSGAVVVSRLRATSDFPPELYQVPPGVSILSEQLRKVN